MSLSRKRDLNDESGLARAHKTIRLREQHPNIAKKIEQELGLSAVAARVLAARGFKVDDDLRNYITPTLKEGLPDPRGLKNLDSACELIAQVVESGQKIAICSDFDVDGLSGGAQVHHFFNSINVENKVFVPDRFKEGYGLNPKMVEQIAAQGFSLLITVDYGTKNGPELALATKLGLRTIVIDHHHVGSDIPACDVFINPNQAGCGFAGGLLCAAGLAWYLIVGLKGKLTAAKGIDPRSYLDLACLGTICDMVPLIGANRVIAKRGLELLATTPRLGLRALKNVIGIYNEVSCSHVSFGIGPRLNAAGRMVHGEMVIDLLTSSDSNQTAKIARQLNKLNIERQDVENLVRESAIKQLERASELPYGIVVSDQKYHTGVIGIVAQRLVEAFYRPSAVLGLDADGIYKGSVRGIKGFSVIGALAKVSKHLVKYGGHEGAGGFSVEHKRIEEFTIAFNLECKRQLKDLETEPYAEADTEVGLHDLSLDLVKELDAFSPFGMGNPGPLLFAKDLRVLDIKILKDTHLKTTLTDGQRYISAFLWRHKNHPALKSGSMVNVAFKPDINTFNGTIEIQANLQAIEST